MKNTSGVPVTQGSEDSAQGWKLIHPIRGLTMSYAINPALRYPPGDEASPFARGCKLSRPIRG